MATTNAAGTVIGSTVVNVYSTNPASTIPTAQNRKEDAILSYNDIVLTYKPTDAVTFTLAPAFYCYLLHGSVGVSGNAVGASGGRSDPNDISVANPLVPNQGILLNNAAFNSDEATDDLYVAMFNGDAKFPVGPFKGKVYWDFAYNATGTERAHHVYGVQEGSFQDSTTWLAGFQLGELKRKHDWYVSADYRQYGLASLDPNLNDPNFALSRLNTQGIRVNLGYNITDWLKAEVWYYGAWKPRKGCSPPLHRGPHGQQRALRRERGAELHRPAHVELLILAASDLSVVGNRAFATSATSTLTTSASNPV